MPEEQVEYDIDPILIKRRSDVVQIESMSKIASRTPFEAGYIQCLFSEDPPLTDVFGSYCK